MGNFALLHALEQMADNPAYKSKIEQVILAAPDIDAKEFRDIAEKIGRVAKGFTLYASANDVAMIASRRAHKDSPRAGDVPVSGPIIVGDIDSIDVSKVSMAYFSIHHNDYVEANDLLNDIAALLRTGTHPPNERNAKFLRLGLPGRVYWRYGQ
jgi:esterase/lipase superfamily enzyme